MPSLKALKNRIASVKSTRKITKAMQMVAAAKLRRAQEAAVAARPYAERMTAVMAGLAASVGGSDSAPRLLSGTVGSFVATDLSTEMLAHAPGELAPRVRADASTLPFRADSFDAVLMINMLLFPHEVDRVLRPGGAVVWVNTLGDQTPIHLPPDDVVTALPGDWVGRTARAGTGFWLTARRR